MKLIKLKSLDLFIAILSAIAVNFFSYAPFLYLSDWLVDHKQNIFISLVAISIMFCLFRAMRSQVNRFEPLVVSFLYIPFAIYALLNFMIIGNLLNDSFTIRTLALVNPVFVLLALFCSHTKRDLIRVTTALSSIYLLFLISGIAGGYITVSSTVSQNIFVGMEGSFYQNINSYLGLFAISCTYFYGINKRYLNFALSGFILFSLSGMLWIGGRSSFVAVIAIFAIYFWDKIVHDASRKRMIVTIAIAIVLFMFMAVAFRSDTVDLLEGSITLRRLTLLTEGGDPSERIYLFGKALELFWSDSGTILFGAGINSYPIYINAFSTGMYPHNVLLELLAEYGITGLVLFVAPIVYIIRCRQKELGSIYGKTVEERTAFLFFVYYCLTYSFTGGLRHSWFLLFYSFLLYPTKSLHRRVVPIRRAPRWLEALDERQLREELTVRR
ncbi:MAG TPA: O-antigen ligase family protein [Bacillota bacterium]|nr:O-antigen ligase family protein [Bacillota bacterium]